MKPNNLLDGIENQINIEKGIKILEFATQYNLQRTYYRNCPLYTATDDHSPQGYLKQMEVSDAMAELNDFLLFPQNQRRVAPQSSQVKSNNQTLSKKSKAKLSIKQNQSQKSNSRPQMKEVEQYIESSPIRELPKRSQPTKINTTSPSNPSKKQEAKALLFKKIAKISETPKIQKSVAKESSFSLSNSKKSQQSNSASFISEESSKQGRDIQDDLVSYHSTVKQMSIIKEDSRENVSRQVPYFKNQLSKSGYNLSDFESIKPQDFIFPMARYHPSPSRHDKSAQADVKSQSYSFLNKSISKIKESNERSLLSSSHPSQTQLSLLRQISPSFVDEENMKILLKLQNFEMEERYILQRMEKRLQQCQRDIEGIRQIDWKTLEMPTTTISFRRPDYAHCIDQIQ